MTLSTAQVAQMRVEAQSLFHDTCVLQTYTAGSQDAVGAAAISYTDGSAMACGFNAQGGREVARADLTTAVSDATVRLPFDTVVDLRSRVKITKRHGATLTTALVFEILSQRRGAANVELELKAVAT
jgi:hypothetical protein